MESINFSTALTGARQLSAELGITLNAAMRIRGLLGAAAQAANTPVEFDPRSPRFNAAAAAEAANLERIRATMDLIQQETREVGLGLASIAGTGGGDQGGVGGSAQAVAEEIKNIKPAIDETSSAMESFRSTAQSAFVGLVTGAKSLKETLSDLLGKFAEFLANSAFQSIFSGGGLGARRSGKGGGGGGFLSSIFAGFFDKGGNIPRGQFGIAGERGMELVQGPAHVTSRADTARMMGGGGGVVVNVDARGAQQGVAEQIVQGISRAIPEITAAVRSGIGARQSRGYAV